MNFSTWKFHCASTLEADLMPWSHTQQSLEFCTLNLVIFKRTTILIINIHATEPFLDYPHSFFCFILNQKKIRVDVWSLFSDLGPSLTWQNPPQCHNRRHHWLSHPIIVVWEAGCWQCVFFFSLLFRCDFVVTLKQTTMEPDVLESTRTLSEYLDILSVNWNKSENFSPSGFFFIILDQIKTVLILTGNRTRSLLHGSQLWCLLDYRTSRSANIINHCPDGHIPASVSPGWQQLLGFQRQFPLRTSEHFNKPKQSHILMPLLSSNNSRY